MFRNTLYNSFHSIIIIVVAETLCCEFITPKIQLHVSNEIINKIRGIKNTKYTKPI